MKKKKKIGGVEVPKGPFSASTGLLIKNHLVKRPDTSFGTYSFLKDWHNQRKLKHPTDSSVRKMVYTLKKLNLIMIVRTEKKGGVFAKNYYAVIKETFDSAKWLQPNKYYRFEFGKKF